MIERYQNDKKYRNIINLIGYGIFILVVIVYVMIGNRSNIESITNENNINNNYDKNNSSEAGNAVILPEKYNYAINIKINDNNYNYSGKYIDGELTINKNNQEEYIYKDNNYYVFESNELIEKNKIYDNVMEEYLNINLINEYLKKAEYDGNNYRVYLKDIILGNNSNKYIIINYTSNANDINIEVDYTNLFNYFNSDIKKYLAVMKYNKIID